MILLLPLVITVHRRLLDELVEQFDGVAIFNIELQVIFVFRQDIGMHGLGSFIYFLGRRHLLLGMDSLCGDGLLGVESMVSIIPNI